MIHRLISKKYELIRAKTPEERFKMGWSMYLTSRKLVIDAIRRENLNISDIDLRIEFFLRFYPDDFSPQERERIIEHIQKCTSDEPFSYVC